MLSDFYIDLLELIDETATLTFFKHYQGLTITVPKKLYSAEKIAKKLATLGPIDLQAKQEFARKYGYSQRQIERLIKRNRGDNSDGQPV